MATALSSKELLRAAAALVMLLACGCASAQLICDGNRRTLNTPIAPFPTAATYFYPIATPAGITCQRRDQPLDATDVALQENQFCGGRESFTCSEGGATFGPIGPITHGTGGVLGSPEAVIPPSNPIIYSLTDAQAYLTFVSFTVVDVGTAGAKLGGVYGSDPNKAPDVVAAYNWTVNGDQGEPLRCGACSDCRQGFGVVPMTVEAAPGAGFRAVQMSALFEDARCGGTCRDIDGMYWSGMEYSCVRPTCGDADLDSPGQQPFDCAALGLVTIPGTEALPNAAPDVCCQTGPTTPPTDSPSPPPPADSPVPPPVDSPVPPPPADSPVSPPPVDSPIPPPPADSPVPPPPADSPMPPPPADSPVPPPPADSPVPPPPADSPVPPPPADSPVPPPPADSPVLPPPADSPVPPPPADSPVPPPPADSPAPPPPADSPVPPPPADSPVPPPPADSPVPPPPADSPAPPPPADSPVPTPPADSPVPQPPADSPVPPPPADSPVPPPPADSPVPPPPADSPVPTPPADSPVPPPPADSPSPPPPADSPSPPPPDFTCASSNAAGERYTCPNGFAYVAGSDALPASFDNCCVCSPTTHHPSFHFGKFGKFAKFGKGGTFAGDACVKPPAPTPPGPAPVHGGKGITIGPITITKPHTHTITQPQTETKSFQVLPFPLPFFGRR
ncbi:hypothetical protein COO60DRAFT_841025 [Scenedesmus sp. NREL 46B-D3]|nr:hypothetical protein COO60DRAFT_841025 [Scenedesmus sp. NREL 46B-D3]